MLPARGRKRGQAGPDGDVIQRSRAACLRLFFCAVALAMSFAGPAAAQAEGDAGGPAEPPATRIAVDEDAGVIRFILGGKEVARFTEDGLRVRDSIEYGGTLTDTGTAHFESTDPAERSAGEGTDAP